MDITLQPATPDDLPASRTLARRGMLPYYSEFDLLWQDAAFDEAWTWREQWVVRRGEAWLGFVSLSADLRALYIRELHLMESVRGQGVGGQVIDLVEELARARRLPLMRLTVFKSNRARALYLRKGFEQVGDDECFYRMERRLLGQR